MVTFPDPFKSFVLCRFLTDDRTGLHVQMFSECTPQLHVVHVQSLLVPLTIPGTKFSTRLHVECEVNSLTTARAVDVESHGIPDSLRSGVMKDY